MSTIIDIKCRVKINYLWLPIADPDSQVGWSTAPGFHVRATLAGINAIKE